MAETKSLGARLKEFLKTPEDRQKIAARFADVPPEELRRFVETMTALGRATAGWEGVRLGPDGEALFEMPGVGLLFEPGDDWYFRPAEMGMCSYESLRTLPLVEIATMNALIDAREARAKTPTAQKPRSGQHGGRPPKVRKAVEKWFEELPPEDRKRSDSKLAQIWKIDPTHEGDEEYVRQVIGELRAELKKT